MKILFIGECDSFSSTLVDKHVKEGDSVSIIAAHDFGKEIKPKHDYKWYHYQAENLNVERIFSSIRPFQVIFAGSLFGADEWHYEPSSNRYLSELLNILNLSAKYQVNKFIYLSSTEVYQHDKSNLIDENGPYGAKTYKGLLSVQGETLVKETGALLSLKTLILRFSDLYGYKPEEDRHDFVNDLGQQFRSLEEIHIDKNRSYSPLHLSDAVEAVFRCAGNTPSNLYNVSSSTQINAMTLAITLKKQLKASASLLAEQGITSNQVDSKLIKKELEWGELRNFEDYLNSYKTSDKALQTDKKPVETEERKARLVIIQTVENIVSFAVMATLSTMFKDHSILKNVDLMTIYIVSISLFFGIRQSILSIILTFAFYLFGLQFDFGNFIHIILNADTFLKLAQYIFMGVVVGYTVDQYKTSFEQKSIEKDFLENEYNELKEINDSNVMIKHQYEKRLISYKTSLPRLYAITNQLDTLDPEVLFSSIIHVLVDVLETETVSVYSYDTKNGYARLISAKNDESIFLGKSFKLSDHQELQHKLLENDIFVGDQWSQDSPAMAGPIFYKGNIIAIILIKQMAFESLNLYQVNLLRTLTSLISSSFIKAYQYEEKIHSEKYIANTEILISPEFKHLIDIKRNDSEQAIADYTLLRLSHTEAPSTYYFKIMSLFRSTDYFGVDSQDRIHVLLRNTATQDIAFVENRLKDKDIHFEVVDLGAVN